MEEQDTKSERPRLSRRQEEQGRIKEIHEEPAVRPHGRVTAGRDLQLTETDEEGSRTEYMVDTEETIGE